MILRSKFTLSRNSSFRLNVWAFKKSQRLQFKVAVFAALLLFYLVSFFAQKIGFFFVILYAKNIDQRNQVYILLCGNIDVRSKGYLFVILTFFLPLYLGNESTKKMRFVVGPRKRFFLFVVFKGKLKYKNIFFPQIKIRSSLIKH